MGYNIPNTFNMNIISIIQTFLSIFERNVYKHFKNLKIPYTLCEYPDLEPGLYYKYNSPCDEVRINISQITQDLSWAVSRIRNEQHQRSRNLGRKLHGEIQARFSSAFLMLQNSQSDP